jgi:hypothetical protein
VHVHPSTNKVRKKNFDLKDRFLFIFAPNINILFRASGRVRFRFRKGVEDDGEAVSL